MSVQVFPLPVPARIMVNNRLGTVKYIGPIQNQSGDWLGVDWDLPDHGKHNGSYLDQSYFQTRFPTSGSFIRYVPKVVHIGQSLIQAITEKYASSSPFNSNGKDVLELKWKQKEINIEVVGLSKLAKKQGLENLKKVDLTNIPVRLELSEFKYIHSLLVNLNELNLSGTLVQSLSELAELCKALPQLSILALNRTRLLPLDTDLIISQDSFQNIKCLSLNETYLEKSQLERILVYFPRLEELYLASNQLVTLPKFPHLPHLHLLDLQNNDIPVSEWKIMVPLRLKQLRAQNNNLSNLQDLPESMNVEQLNLSSNFIEDWKEINTLRLWSSLKHLRIQGNPAYSDAKLGRVQVIARLPQLQMLNGSEISQAQRNSAERYFLKLVFTELVEQKKDPFSEAVHSIYPKLTDLIQKHGEPVINATLKDHLETKLVQIRPHLSTSNSIPSDCFDFNICLSSTVLQLRYILARFLKLQPLSILIQSNGVSWDDVTKLVSFYILDDTSTLDIIVN